MTNPMTGAVPGAGYRLAASAEMLFVDLPSTTSAAAVS